MPLARSLPRTLRAAILASPILPLTALALVALAIMAPSNGGYFPSWYTAALVVLGLLVVALVAVPLRTPPIRPVTVACVALAAYAGWSYLSIAWAAQKGDAWDGANRTAMYAILFALFALWSLRGRSAAVLVGAFVLVVAGVGLVELLVAAGAADPSGHFIDGRFASPMGYPNAAAALWSSAFWPCVVLGSRREVPPWLRGAFLGSAVLLGGLALMGQSRGWLFALPIVAVIFLIVTPGRVRTTLTLLLVLGGVGITIPAALDVFDKSGRALADAMGTAANWILGVAVAVGAIGALAAAADRRRRPSRLAARRAGAVLLVSGAFLLCTGTVVYFAERGSPFTDIGHAWNQFKTQPTPEHGSGRLVRLGSSRYDFWRVAWGRFEHAPIVGIGADNFQEAYLLRRRSDEQPRFPHSLELRTLSQTGLIGALLLGTALVAALMAAGRAIRQRAGPGAAAAAAGLAGFSYWLVHGSIDWFWEFPALGGAAFALVGIAAGLAPRRPALRPERRRRPLISAALAAAVVMVGGLVVAASFGGPWLSQRYIDQAVGIWPRQPADAFAKLNRAAALNPLSARPKLFAGAIALRLGYRNDAERFFRQAIERDPGDSFAHLELGAVAFDAGHHTTGLWFLRRAAHLDPRDGITARALHRALRGKRIDIAAMNADIAARARGIGRR